MGVPSQYKQVHWYGRGPHECYPDRQHGAPLRQYSVADVKEFHVPYIFPSAGTTSSFDINASPMISMFHESPGYQNPSWRAGENGGRSDTRWVTLSDEGGAGIAAISLTAPMQINATRSAATYAPYMLQPGMTCHTILLPLIGKPAWRMSDC